MPDPESTHLALYTDRFIESVMWAASDSGFIFSKYSFPWNAKPEKETTRFADRQMQQNESDRRRNQPGLMLFRAKRLKSGPDATGISGAGGANFRRESDSVEECAGSA